MAADRGAFIDQSQSLNLFLAEADPSKLTSMHFYAWRKGLKTGMYYLRTRPAVDAIKFTVDQLSLRQPQHQANEGNVSRNSMASSNAAGTDTTTTTTTIGSASVHTIHSVLSDHSPLEEEEKSENNATISFTTESFCTKEEGCLMCGS